MDVHQATYSISVGLAGIRQFEEELVKEINSQPLNARSNSLEARVEKNKKTDLSIVLHTARGTFFDVSLNRGVLAKAKASLQLADRERVVEYAKSI